MSSPAVKTGVQVNEPSASNPLAGVVGDMISGIVNDPDNQKKALSWLVSLIGGAIGGLFKKKKPAPAPTVPVVTPTPAPEQPDPKFPDDIIPAPKAAVVVKSVRLKLARVQFNKQRFPEQYTSDNPQGLESNARLREIEAGAALNYANKAWYDLTAFDEKGNEILRDRVLSGDLAYRTRFEFNNGFYQGKGAEAGTGLPMEPEQKDPDGLTYGWEAWRSSLGFLIQVKHHEQGSYEVSGEVAGVKSNKLVINVS